MMVLTPLTNPLWFAEKGGWPKRENIDMWVDFSKKLVDEFGHYVLTGTLLMNQCLCQRWLDNGAVSTFQNNLFTALKVIDNMGLLIILYMIISKQSTPVSRWA